MRNYDSTWRHHKTLIESACGGRKIVILSSFGLAREISQRRLCVPLKERFLFLISLIPWWTARCLHGSPGGLAPGRADRSLECALVLCFYLSVPLPLQRTHFPMQQRHPAGLLGRSKIRASTVSSPLFCLQCCGSLSPSAPLIFGTYFVWVLLTFWILDTTIYLKLYLFQVMCF